MNEKKENLEVCIITPTWNNEDYTIRCFRSIAENTKLNYRIIWIDNGSEKESREKVKKFLDGNDVPYELIQNQENLGFVKATNIGIERAIDLGAKYVVLQNNDTEVYENWINDMIEIAKADPMIGVVGPLTSPCKSWQSIENVAKEILMPSELPKYDNNPKEYADIIRRKYRGETREARSMVAFFSTLIKTEVIREVGILSEEYGIGLCDDDDYCARVKKSGWKIMLALNVFVFHNHQTTFRKKFSEEEIKKMKMKNVKIFREKHNVYLNNLKVSSFLERLKKIRNFSGKHFNYIMNEAFKIYKKKGILKMLRFFYKYLRYGRLEFLIKDEKNRKLPLKFNFIDSSKTWYGIASQLEKQLIRLGLVPDNKGISICYANDIGEIDPRTLQKINLKNRETLRRVYKSKAEFLFYSQKSCEKWFEKRKNAFYLPSGVDTDIFKLYEEGRNIDVGFVGKNYGLPIRNDFISKLEKHKGEFSFENYRGGSLYFENLARFYNRCKIVVNDSQQNEITMRMFEATACGSLLVTREVPYLEELFEFNKEIVVYKNFEEMIEKIKYYLENEEERKNIAEKGRQRTISTHSYYDRAKFILEKINQ